MAPPCSKRLLSSWSCPSEKEGCLSGPNEPTVIGPSSGLVGEICFMKRMASPEGARIHHRSSLLNPGFAIEPRPGDFNSWDSSQSRWSTASVLVLLAPCLHKQKHMLHYQPGWNTSVCECCQSSLACWSLLDEVERTRMPPDTASEDFIHQHQAAREPAIEEIKFLWKPEEIERRQLFLDEVERRIFIVEFCSRLLHQWWPSPPWEWAMTSSGCIICHFDARWF